MSKKHRNPKQQGFELVDEILERPTKREVVNKKTGEVTEAEAPRQTKSQLDDVKEQIVVEAVELANFKRGTITPLRSLVKIYERLQKEAEL